MSLAWGPGHASPPAWGFSEDGTARVQFSRSRRFLNMGPGFLLPGLRGALEMCARLQRLTLWLCREMN
jgi:hypothetical protein